MQLSGDVGEVGVGAEVPTHEVRHVRSTDARRLRYVRCLVLTKVVRHYLVIRWLL